MMRRMTTREIDSLAALDDALDGTRSLAGLRIQGVDLSAREALLLSCDPAGAVVLGGRSPTGSSSTCATAGRWFSRP